MIIKVPKVKKAVSDIAEDAGGEVEKIEITYTQTNDGLLENNERVCVSFTLHPCDPVVTSLAASLADGITHELKTKARVCKAPKK